MRITRRRARAILDQHAAGDDALGRLLAAAAAPQPGDAAAEMAAVAQFRAHAPSSRPPTRRPSMIKSMLTKVVAAKILAGTAVAAATGGVALAAADGHFSPHSRLAAPATSSAQPTDPAASDSSTDASPTLPSVPPTDGTSTSADETSGSAEPSRAVPSPSLHGLCTAYLAGVANSHGKALQNPAFTVLINAAGGPDGVSGYCATLLSSSPAAHPGKPSTHPAHPTHPAMPTQADNTHRAQPTQPPASHTNHSGGHEQEPTAAPSS